MKVNFLAIVTILAATAKAAESFYDPTDNTTCTLKDDGSLSCLEGKIDGVRVLDVAAQEGATPDDKDVDGGEEKRGLKGRGLTCAFRGVSGCRAKCHRIHGKPCGGRCLDDGWPWGHICYCSARC
ncbi:hypothetical protein Q8F55_003291 [Vanrija albida]|uniref:Invertebrate defensins family profile domain-containing protein n=1 Tax=Vanrija albida TaxID=181172 RepID=A0ABR3Q3U2_9TREE